MKTFFKLLFANFFGSLLAFGLLVIILVAIIASSISSVQESAEEIKDNSILQLTLSGEITDRENSSPLKNLNFQSSEMGSGLGLDMILANIKKAALDPKIKGIYLELTSLQAGIGTIDEIRQSLSAFKASKKFIISYADAYSQATYYLASVADKVYLNPQGAVLLKGLGAELMFYKGILEKIGVEFTVIRHGKFKSAVEPFISDKMSPENRLQTEKFVGSIWKSIVDSIAASRSLDPQKINDIADQLELTDATACVNKKIVDELKYKDQVYDELKKLSKLGKDDKTRFVSLKKYDKVPSTIKKEGSIDSKIAIIYASGEIVDGKGKDDQIGSETLSEAVRTARLDKKVKAIVLRINSPGGSALASEIIWREVSLAKKEKKVIVSMGDVAASGGYYIASPADVIVAEPTTITGSIGVFGLMPSAQKLLNEKLGITIDRVKTNKHSDMGTITRIPDKDEEVFIQSEIENVYKTFVGHVADGRKMTASQVDSIGQGRVWSGSNAQTIGLVDQFGGLNKAIAVAAKEAKLKQYKIMILPERKDNFLTGVLKMMDTETRIDLTRKSLGEAGRYIELIEKASTMKGVQARLPFVISANL